MGFNVMLYILIFLAKIVEVAIFTIRTILTARDEKIINTILSFIQNMIWVVSTAYVLQDIQSDIFKALAYAGGSAAGCYIGMKLEELIALGQNLVMVIVDEADEKNLAKLIRENGYAVTELQGKGKEKNRGVLMIVTKRRKEKVLFKLVQDNAKGAMIMNSATNTYGGYL